MGMTSISLALGILILLEKNRLGGGGGILAALGQPLDRDGGRIVVCIVDNGICTGPETQLIASVNSVRHRNGCKEKCYEDSRCQWWTWFEEGSATNPMTCFLYTSCPQRDPSLCTYCYSGQRNCFSDDGPSASAVIGGNDMLAAATANVEVFEEEKHCQPGVVADLPPDLVRCHHTSARLQNVLYACGGREPDKADIVTNTCLYYDVFQGYWNEDMEPMKQARTNAAALAVYGELYVLGGDDGNDVLSSVEIYNDEMGGWRPGVDLPAGRTEHCVTRIGDNIYVLGGKTRTQRGMHSLYPDDNDSVDMALTFDKYNLVTESWTKLAAPPTPRRHHSCVVLSPSAAASRNGSVILAAGGQDRDGRVLSSVERYDVDSNRWHAAAGMNHARSSFGLTILNGKVRAVGGDNGEETIKSAEELTPDMDDWLTIELELEEARASFSITNVPLELLAGC